MFNSGANVIIISYFLFLYYINGFLQYTQFKVLKEDEYAWKLDIHLYCARAKIVR
jgi:hypothetical protein